MVLGKKQVADWNTDMNQKLGGMFFFKNWPCSDIRCSMMSFEIGKKKKYAACVAWCLPCETEKKMFLPDKDRRKKKNRTADWSGCVLKQRSTFSDRSWIQSAVLAPYQMQAHVLSHWACWMGKGEEGAREQYSQTKQEYAAFTPCFMARDKCFLADVEVELHSTVQFLATYSWL